MILILSDTHCNYNIINEQIKHAQNTLGKKISSVIHLGDFGIFRSQLKDFFIKKKERFLCPVYFIEGNHEDFNAFSSLVEKYKDYFTYLPRGSVFNIEGYRFLALGGSAYMDALSTQQGAIISDTNIDDCLNLAADSIDIILTHDCPSDIGVSNKAGLEHYGKPGFPRSKELEDYFKPKLWLFGHHHHWFKYKNKKTSFFGFSESWNGFGLLDKNFKLTIVKHTIEKKKSFIDKVLIKLNIVRP
jgi:predicted phosphodiesterase